MIPRCRSPHNRVIPSFALQAGRGRLTEWSIHIIIDANYKKSLEGSLNLLLSATIQTDRFSEAAQLQPPLSPDDRQGAPQLDSVRQRSAFSASDDGPSAVLLAGARFFRIGIC